MARLLLNAAMIPGEGTFEYHRITAEDAAMWLRRDDFISYIGYKQTARHCEDLARAVEYPGAGYPACDGGCSDVPHVHEWNIKVPLNRAKCEMVEGDEALVVKLAYRVADPTTKGQPQPEDWEYGILKRLDTRGVALAGVTALHALGIETLGVGGELAMMAQRALEVR
jgi:hypothetical protein